MRGSAMTSWGRSLVVTAAAAGAPEGSGCSRGSTQDSLACEHAWEEVKKGTPARPGLFRGRYSFFCHCRDAMGKHGTLGGSQGSFGPKCKVSAL